MDAELEVRRTIKRAELTAFFCLLKTVVGPIKVHVDNKGTIDGLWRGERKCFDPKAGDADLWIKELRTVVGQKGSPLTFLLLHFSHHIPHLCCHSPSTVREKACFAVTFPQESHAGTVNTVKEELLPSCILNTVSCCHLPSVPFCLSLSASAKTDLAHACYDGETFPPFTHVLFHAK